MEKVDYDVRKIIKRQQRIISRRTGMHRYELQSVQ